MNLPAADRHTYMFAVLSLCYDVQENWPGGAYSQLRLVFPFVPSSTAPDYVASNPRIAACHTCWTHPAEGGRADVHHAVGATAR
jgi:hypothetical protein